MKLKRMSKYAIYGKTVVLVVDFDCPTREKDHQQTIIDDTRILRSLPTIRRLLSWKTRLIIITKRGRPDGKPDPQQTVNILADYLSSQLNQKVLKLDQITGPSVDQAISRTKPGEVVMLENIRFHPGETNNDPQLAKDLANLGDIYVNDAFPMCHRPHTSVYGIPQYLPAYAGDALAEEVQMLGQILESPRRPFVCVVGGKKISDKVAAVNHLTKLADVVLVGGGVANYFLAAEGYNIADSFIETNNGLGDKNQVSYIDVARNLLNLTRLQRMLLDGYIPLPKILYPLDVLAAAKPTASPQPLTLINDGHRLSKSLQYLDIGEKTIHLFRRVIAGAATVFWNGPMGVFEQPSFSHGTRAVTQAIAKSPAVTIVGGGDTINALNTFSHESRFDYVSAAGGASLEFLSGNLLPGLKWLVE